MWTSLFKKHLAKCPSLLLGEKVEHLDTPKLKKGGQPKPTAIIQGLFSFAVFPGNPAHAPVHHDGMPAVFGSGDPLK